MNKPNFFILGAAKSGTTSLYYYLNQHPMIYMSPIKEPTFFCNGFQKVKNPIDYFRLYDGVGKETIIGEASHAYLSNPLTAKVLKTLFPNAKFLVILRNPADRAYSLYNHMRRNGYEHAGSFEKALKLEEKRILSKRFIKNCPQYYYNFLYFRSGLYGEQLQRYFSLFNRKQFHIITLEQFKKNPQHAIASILQFLQIDMDFKLEFKAVHNKTTETARIAWLQYLWQSKIKHPRIIQRTALSLLKRTNFFKVPPNDQNTKRDLLKRYATDLNLLCQLTNLNWNNIFDNP